MGSSFLFLPSSRESVAGFHIPYGLLPLYGLTVLLSSKQKAPAKAEAFASQVNEITWR
ncbi:hypothetical protein GCM10011586_29870 [Silvibacterium dinghuense]|nr:hypothetical protein GCM10011586_29870 [Silvibacterium dinghuense]